MFEHGCKSLALKRVPFPNVGDTKASGVLGPQLWFVSELAHIREM